MFYIILTPFMLEGAPFCAVLYLTLHWSEETRMVCCTDLDGAG